MVNWLVHFNVESDIQTPPLPQLLPLPPCVSTDFLITASIDGHVKFWKKQENGIEFVKHFRAHLGKVVDMATSSDGLLLCTVSDDKSMKVFDVINFGEPSLLQVQVALIHCFYINT